MQGMEKGHSCPRQRSSWVASFNFSFAKGSTGRRASGEPRLPCHSEVSAHPSTQGQRLANFTSFLLFPASLPARRRRNRPAGGKDAGSGASPPLRGGGRSGGGGGGRGRVSSGSRPLLRLGGLGALPSGRRRPRQPPAWAGTPSRFGGGGEAAGGGRPLPHCGARAPSTAFLGEMSFRRKNALFFRSAPALSDRAVLLESEF